MSDADTTRKVGRQRSLSIRDQQAAAPDLSSSTRNRKLVTQSQFSYEVASPRCDFCARRKQTPARMTGENSYQKSQSVQMSGDFMGSDSLAHFAPLSFHIMRKLGALRGRKELPLTSSDHFIKLIYNQE